MSTDGLSIFLILCVFLQAMSFSSTKTHCQCHFKSFWMTNTRFEDGQSLKSKTAFESIVAGKGCMGIWKDSVAERKEVRRGVFEMEQT